MKKQEYLNALAETLSSLSDKERQEALDYYSEMIDDRMEEGLSEEDAVKATDSAQSNILIRPAITPLPVKTAPPPRKARRSTGERILLILGSPLWVPLTLCALIVLVALYLVLWAIVICLYAAEVSFAACSLGALFCAALYLVRSNPDAALFFLACALALAGLSMVWWFVCKLSAKGTVTLGAFGIRRTAAICSRKEKHT